MKQQVNDISGIILSLSEQIKSMQKTIDSQQATLCRINRTNQCQLKKIQNLKYKLKKKDREIEELRHRLSIYEAPPKNSGNSSTPPSKEKMKDEVLRRTKSLQKPAGKRQGRQIGHEDSTLGMAEEADIINREIPTICDACYDSLDDCPEKLDSISQIISLPVLKPIITEIPLCKGVSYMR